MFSQANQQQTQPTDGVDARILTRVWPHWWEASAVTIAPPLLLEIHPWDLSAFLSAHKKK